MAAGLMLKLMESENYPFVAGIANLSCLRLAAQEANKR
jgi:hypothetical protein